MCAFPNIRSTCQQDWRTGKTIASTMENITVICTVQVAGKSFVSAGLLESLQDVIAVWILQASGGSLSWKVFFELVRQQ